MITPRELQVADLISRGMCEKEAAHALGVQQSTINRHKHNILRKLDVHTAAHMVRRMFELGLLP